MADLGAVGASGSLTAGGVASLSNGGPLGSGLALSGDARRIVLPLAYTLLTQTGAAAGDPLPAHQPAAIAGAVTGEISVPPAGGLVGVLG